MSEVLFVGVPTSVTPKTATTISNLKHQNTNHDALRPLILLFSLIMNFVCGAVTFASTPPSLPQKASPTDRSPRTNFELVPPTFASENLVQRSMVRVSLQEDCLHGEVVMVMMMVMWQTAPSVERDDVLRMV